MKELLKVFESFMEEDYLGNTQRKRKKGEAIDVERVLEEIEGSLNYLGALLCSETEDRVDDEIYKGMDELLKSIKQSKRGRRQENINKENKGQEDTEERDNSKINEKMEIMEYFEAPKVKVQNAEDFSNMLKSILKASQDDVVRDKPFKNNQKQRNNRNSKGFGERREGRSNKENFKKSNSAEERGKGIRNRKGELRPRKVRPEDKMYTVKELKVVNELAYQKLYNDWTEKQSTDWGREMEGIAEIYGEIFQTPIKIATQGMEFLIKFHPVINARDDDNGDAIRMRIMIEDYFDKELLEKRDGYYTPQMYKGKMDVEIQRRIWEYYYYYSPMIEIFEISKEEIIVDMFISFAEVVVNKRMKEVSQESYGKDSEMKGEKYNIQGELVKK